MGCNCKNERKIEKLFNNNNNIAAEKRGLMYFVLKILQMFLEIINKLITITLILVLTPIVIVVLLFGYIFNGTLKINIPFKINKLITKYYAKQSQDKDEPK